MDKKKKKVLFHIYLFFFFEAFCCVLQWIETGNLREKEPALCQRSAHSLGNIWDGPEKLNTHTAFPLHRDRLFPLYTQNCLFLLSMLYFCPCFLFLFFFVKLKRVSQLLPAHNLTVSVERTEFTLRFIWICFN